MKTGSGRAVVVCLILILAAGCSGAARMQPVCQPMEAGFRPDASMSAEYPYSELKEGKALIIFLRPSRFSPEDVIEVLANGKNVGVLRAKRYTLVQAKPGSNRFLARAAEQEPVQFDLLVEPGKVYFIELAPGKRTVSARLQGHLISPEDGRTVLQSCELEKKSPASEED
jgi:hypothetical protein